VHGVKRTVVMYRDEQCEHKRRSHFMPDRNNEPSDLAGECRMERPFYKYLAQVFREKMFVHRWPPESITSNEHWFSGKMYASDTVAVERRATSVSHVFVGYRTETRRAVVLLLRPKLQIRHDIPGGGHIHVFTFV